MDFRELHTIYSGLRGGDVTDRLCHDCVISRLGNHIAGKTILFFEPLSNDSYVFVPVTECDRSPIASDRMAQVLDSKHGSCTRCSSPSRHVWIPQIDLDEEAMETQVTDQFYLIPREPADCLGATYFCDTHLLVHLRSYLEDRACHFLTFRLPDSSTRGFYW